MGGQDVVLSWTAPAAGTYLFATTRDATLVNDTVLSVFDGDCQGMELACDDDALPISFRSFLSLPLAADQTVAIVVDGYNHTNTGTIELYIDVFPDAQPGGSCCAHDAGVGGCDAERIEACVCTLDESCCDTDWDVQCVIAAYSSCNAECSCFEGASCDAPSDDCICMGCNVDGVCDTADDCIDCVDCEGSPLCGCNSDGVCDPYNESCACADCADEAVCA